MTSLPPPPPLFTPTASSVATPTANDALKHIIKTIFFPNAAVELEAFFEYFGINNVNDFITLEEADFKINYSNAKDTSTFYALSPLIQKMLCALQIWYV